MNFKSLDKSEISDLDNFRLDRFTTFLLTNLLFNLPFNIVASLPSSFKCSCISLFSKNSLSFLPQISLGRFKSLPKVLQLSQIKVDSLPVSFKERR